MDRTAAFWDGIAERYAARPVKDMAAYETTLTRTRSHLRAQDTVLELGCGTGSTALRLADAVRHVTATDLSGRMLAIGREKAERAGVGNVTFAQATPFDHRFGRESFDAVLAFNLLHLIGDVPAALRCVHGLLKPGGRFISKTPCLAGRDLFIRGMVAALRLVGKAPPVFFYTPYEMQRYMEDAGFAIIETGDYPRSPPAHFIAARKRD